MSAAHLDAWLKYEILKAVHFQASQMGSKYLQYFISIQLMLHLY